jgi:hypothetical protein
MTDRKNIATAKAEFHLWMAHRRKHRGNATEWAWATRAARKLVWIMRAVPASEWPNV